MFQKRTFTARMLWTALIMLFMFVSFFATPTTLTHANSHGTTGLRMHRPMYKDGAKHAVSGIVSIDRSAGAMALCASLQPGKTTTLNIPGGLQPNDHVEVSWYTNNQCRNHAPASTPSKSKSYKSKSYTINHLPYTITFPWRLVHFCAREITVLVLVVTSGELQKGALARKQVATQ